MSGGKPVPSGKGVTSRRATKEGVPEKRRRTTKQGVPEKREASILLV
jgi:hypothetical protein